MHAFLCSLENVLFLKNDNARPLLIKLKSNHYIEIFYCILLTEPAYFLRSIFQKITLTLLWQTVTHGKEINPSLSVLFTQNISTRNKKISFTMGFWSLFIMMYLFLRNNFNISDI